MKWSKVVNVVSAHAAGEVGKVITGGVLDIPGETILEKMKYINEQDDSLRRLLVHEPRGSSQISVNLLLPPVNPKADASFFPMQADACHEMSGSNAICVTTVLLETGILTMHEPITKVVLDTPSGLVTATAKCRKGICEKVSLDFGPSFVEHLQHPLEVEGWGTLQVDVAFGGVYFVLIDAEQIGIPILPENARKLVEAGTAIHRAACEQIPVSHPEIPEINKIGYAMFHAKISDNPMVLKGGTVMFPGRMDRSPCGTGSAARLAVLHARKEIAVGQPICQHSIIDSRFELEIIGTTMVSGRSAILPRISGSAWIYAQTQYGIDPSDPYPLGYMLADTWGPGVEHILNNQ